MTMSAVLTVEDVSDGPAPVVVLASANVEDGSLAVTEGSLDHVEVKFVFNQDEVPFQIGDVITTLSGHFST